MKKKSPGFWFFTGDWLKDPELRFCSIFARGLLVDLLCYMFEAKERGYMTWADGSPRTDREIVDAISGGSTEEKLAALEELVRKGVLSRDSRGALYSRRLSKLNELSEARRKSGSKGGSKKVANRLAKTNQKCEDTDTVSVTASASVSDTVTDKGNTPPNPRRGKSWRAEDEELPDSIKTSEMQDAWRAWCSHRREIGKAIKPTQCKAMMQELVELGVDRSLAAIRHTIRKGWQGLKEPDSEFSRNYTSHQKPPQQTFLEQIEQRRKELTQ